MSEATTLELVRIMRTMNDAIELVNESIKGLTEITRGHGESIERLEAIVDYNDGGP